MLPREMCPGTSGQIAVHVWSQRTEVNVWFLASVTVLLNLVQVACCMDLKQWVVSSGVSVESRTKNAALMGNSHCLVGAFARSVGGAVQLPSDQP